MHNEELTKKYDITNDPNVKKFSKKLTHLLNRIRKEGYKVWSSGYESQGLWITKAGIHTKFDADPSTTIDSGKALMQLVSDELVEDLDTDDCQLVEDK